VPVGRYARHAVAGLRQELREKIVYAMDLQEGSQGPTLTTLGVSPVWELHTNDDEDVCGDLKIPIDRVPETPIDVKIVFAVSQGGGEGNVLLNLDTLIASEGIDLTGATARDGLVVSCPAANNQQTTGYMRIHPNRLDGLVSSADIQFRVQREGTHDLDTHAGNVLLVKVIFEYTAYV